MTTPSNTPAESPQSGTGDPAPQSAPAAATQVPAAAPQQSSPAAPQHAGPNFGEVLNAIQALPEQIVNGIREATQPAKAPAQPASNAGTQAQGNAAQVPAQAPVGGTASKPQNKSFREWWFGG